MHNEQQEREAFETAYQADWRDPGMAMEREHFSRGFRAALAAPAAPQEPIGHHHLTTSAGGRAYIAEYFAKRLRRHDFERYIHESLAADFACALAQHLAAVAPVAPQAQPSDEELLDFYRSHAGYEIKHSDVRALHMLRALLSCYGAARQATNPSNNIGCLSDLAECEGQGGGQAAPSDEDLKALFDGIDFSSMVTADDLFYLIARAVLQRYGQAPAASAEPVYLLEEEEGPGQWSEINEATFKWWQSQGTRVVRNLYAAPVAAQAPQDALIFECGKAAGRQEVKDEQQSPNFWTWIRRAYREPESTAYTVHNMEVAYQAGRTAQAPAADGDALDASMWRYCEQHGFPRGARQIHPTEGDLYWYWGDNCFTAERYPSARAAIVAAMQRTTGSEK